MKKLGLTVVFIAIALPGYYAYSQYQQQIALQQAVERLQQEQQELQKAQQSNSITELNRFIKDHPQSDWIERAIYERDKLAYHQAIETNQVKALEAFIAEYADSQWLPQASNRLQRLKQEQKLLAEMELKQQQLDIQRQQIAKQQQQQQAEAQQQAEEMQAPKQISTGLSGRDRVARALAIYEKQRQQQQQVNNEQLKQQQKDEKLQQKCIRVKDQITQYEQRVRWYDLDKNGKRIYLSKQEVAQKKQQLQQQYQEYCQ